MQNTDLSKLKIASYRRKSSEGEDRQALSLDSQFMELKRVQEYHKLPNFINDFKDAKSAKLQGLRLEFNQLWQKVMNKEIDCIVCWKLDRLARNMEEGGRIIDALSSGILKAVITYDKVWYPTDNVLAMAVEFGQGKQYVKDLSQNVKRGYRIKAERGLPSWLAPLGYLNSKQGNKGERYWLVDDERFWKVKKLFEEYLTGKHSISSIHKYALNELHLTTPIRGKFGNKSITRGNTYRLLLNEVYAGFFFTQGEKYYLDKSLPKVISEEQHEKILLMLSYKQKSKAQIHKSLYSNFLMSDIGNFMGQDIKFQLICDCKHKFAYLNKTNCPKCKKSISDMVSPSYYSRTYYYDVKKKKAGDDYKAISENTVNDFMVDFVENNLQMPKVLLDWSKKYIHELKDKEVLDNINLTADRNKRQEDYTRKKGRLREMLRDVQITDEEYKEDLISLEKMYSDLKTEDYQGVNWFEQMSDIVNLTETIKNTLLSGTFESKRNVLGRLGSNLIWDDKNLLIINTKPINALIDGLKLARPYFYKFEQEKSLDLQGLSSDFEHVGLRMRKW